jgi:GMC oxidoreductase
VSQFRAEGERSVQLPRFEEAPHIKVWREPSVQHRKPEPNERCESFFSASGSNPSHLPYLYPIMDQPNLTVLTGAFVNKLMTEGTAVTGGEFEWRGEVRTIKVSSEVVLSAGAIQTPKILMLTGIGDRAELARFGIASVSNEFKRSSFFQFALHAPLIVRGITSGSRGRERGPFTCVWRYPTTPSRWLFA